MRPQLIFAAVFIAAVLAAVLYFLPRPVGPADNPGTGVNTGPTTEQQKRAGQTQNSGEAAGSGREAPPR